MPIPRPPQSERAPLEQRLRRIRDRGRGLRQAARGERREQTEQLETALQGLSERERAGSGLHHGHGLGLQSVADRLGIGFSTVRRACDSAVASLRAPLEAG